MKQLVVGLGNPGLPYQGTRHNVGFEVVEALAEKWGLSWKSHPSFFAKMAQREELLLVEPLSFMNLSGRAIGALQGFFKIPPVEILVVTDDADLPLGQLRLRAKGSSGGHRGLENIEEVLQTRDYPRLRIGIGRPEGRESLEAWVLQRFKKEEWDRVQEAIREAVAVVEMFLREGIDAAMRSTNTPNRSTHNEEKNS